MTPRAEGFGAAPNPAPSAERCGAARFRLRPLADNADFAGLAETTTATTFALGLGGDGLALKDKTNAVEVSAKSALSVCSARRRVAPPTFRRSELVCR
jgi:hypothetical protein